MKFEGLTMNQLAERNAVLVQELEKAREVTNCPDGVELQEHLKQLVAENLTLKSAAKKVIKLNREHAKERHGNADIAESWNYVKVLRNAKSETPATDSILRAAEARGVEKFVVKTARQLFSPESNAAQGLTYLACANEFVKQLREGKAE